MLSQPPCSRTSLLLRYTCTRDLRGPAHPRTSRTPRIERLSHIAKEREVSVPSPNLPNAAAGCQGDSLLQGDGTRHCHGVCRREGACQCDGACPCEAAFPYDPATNETASAHVAPPAIVTPPAHVTFGRVVVAISRVRYWNSWRPMLRWNLRRTERRWKVTI